MSTSKTMKKVLRDKRGQSVIEYVLILFIVVILVGKFKETIIGKVQGLLGEMDGKIKEATSE